MSFSLDPSAPASGTKLRVTVRQALQAIEECALGRLVKRARLQMHATDDAECVIAAAVQLAAVQLRAHARCSV